MRDALLAMKTLYREGTMNRDIAVITEALFREYIAGGKAGIVYGAGYICVTAFGPLYAADPNADFVAIIPPSLKGKENHIVQADAFQARKIFVNSKCKNPEGVVQIANLSLKLYREKPQEYFRGIVNGASFPWFKYITFGDTIVPGTYDFDVGNAIRQAEKGDMSYMQDAAMLEYYDRFKQGKTDRSMKIWVDAYGIYPDRPGSRTVEYDLHHANRTVWTAFGGLPTETMALKLNVIDGELQAATTEVVMGANISVFDQAVRKWRSEGGDQITKEVNDWYKSLR
jgi:putative aldouronate transport system substrate-binding protein